MSVLFNVRTRYAPVNSTAPVNAAGLRNFAQLRSATGFWSLPMRIRSGARQLELQKAANEAISHVVTGGFAVNDNTRRTFQKIGEKLDRAPLQVKSLADCRRDINLIGNKIDALEAERERYIQQGLISKEKIKDKKTFINRVDAALVLRDVVAGIAVPAANPAAADVAIRAVLVPPANPNLGDKQAINNQFVGQAATQGLQKLLADANARVAFLQTPAGGNMNPVNANAQAAAEMLAKAKELAEKIYKDANDNLVDKLSLGLKSIKTQIDTLHEELMSVQAQTLQCLCFGNKIDYASNSNWETYFGTVVDLYNKAADKHARRLDGVSLSLGLPVLRDERTEASVKTKIRNQIDFRKHPLRNVSASVLGFTSVGVAAANTAGYIGATGWGGLAVALIGGVGAVVGGAAVAVTIGAAMYGVSKLFEDDEM